MGSQFLSSMGLGNIDLGLIIFILVIVLLIAVILIAVLWGQLCKLKRRYNKFCAGKNAKSLEKEIMQGSENLAKRIRRILELSIILSNPLIRRPVL